MEISNQQIQTELLQLSDELNDLFQRLMMDESCTRDLTEKALLNFGNQDAGRELTIELTQTMREIQQAHCELEQLKGVVIEFTRVLIT